MVDHLMERISKTLTKESSRTEEKTTIHAYWDNSQTLQNKIDKIVSGNNQFFRLDDTQVQTY